jgi:hypothetical protein
MNKLAIFATSPSLTQARKEAGAKFVGMAGVPFRFAGA